MEPGEMVVTVAQEFQNMHVWDGCAAKVTCVVSTQKHVLEVAHEQEDAHQKTKLMEQETRQFQQEQHESQEQLADLLQKFSEEVKKVETLRAQVQEKQPEMALKKEMSDASLMTEPMQNPMQTLSYKIMKILNPPQICVFSGNDPVPKDEGTVDQWEFQVRGSLATHTENSVRAVIVNSLWGPARDLIGFVGFDANLEKILEEVIN